MQTFWVQSYTFARLALTEGQHRPKAGEHRRGSFFSGSSFVLDVPSGSGYNTLFPVRHIYLSSILARFKAVKRAGRIARARVGHMPRHTIPTCPIDV